VKRAEGVTHIMRAVDIKITRMKVNRENELNQHHKRASFAEWKTQREKQEEKRKKTAVKLN